MDSQPELFAQHYAEAGLVEKSVAYWGKAGRRSAARSAMAEAAAQLQKGLDQLALLPEPRTPATGARILERPGRGVARQRPGGAGNGPCLCPRARVVGAAGFPLGVPSRSLWAVSLSCSRRIRCGAALDEDLLRLSRQRKEPPGSFWVTPPPVET